MKQSVYLIFDECEEEFVLQVFYSNDNVAKREMTQLFENKVLSRQLPSIERYPNTFALYKVADYDTKTGIISPLDVKIPILNFGDLVHTQSE